MRAAVCNELCADRPLAEACRLIARHGFRGVELAPYTLADDPTKLSAARLREIRVAIETAGLACAGLHWLLKAPAGLHLTTADPTVRRRSWDALRRLIDLCAALGGEVMVLGSGRQRSAQGLDRAVALDALTDGLASLAETAGAARIRLLLEALPASSTDVVNTLEEARAAIAAVGHPAVSGMFDFHNSRDETEPWEGLIERHGAIIHHVHLNEADGYHPSLVRRPGRRRSEFGPAFRALAARGYAGWISLEIFHAAEPPETILAETRAFLESAAPAAGGASDGESVGIPTH